MTVMRRPRCVYLDVARRNSVAQVAGDLLGRHFATAKAQPFHSGTKVRRRGSILEVRLRSGELEQAMTILKWALIFLVISIIAGILGFTGVSAASADIARFLFYVFVVIFLVLLILGLTIFRA
jgi:uncharacterized membrane protein YtjA (UPF0391 family)